MLLLQEAGRVQADSGKDFVLSRELVIMEFNKRSSFTIGFVVKFFYLSVISVATRFKG